MKKTSLKHKLVVALIVIIIVVGTTLIFHVTQGPFKQFIQGKRLFDKEAYQKALPLFLSAYQLEPQNIQTAWYLLWTYDKLDQQEKRKEMLELLLKSYPQDIALMEQLADINYAQSDYVKAEIIYKKILELKPDNLTVQRKLAQVLTWQKKYSEALPILMSLHKNNIKDNQAGELLADAYYGSRDYKTAERLYRLVLADKKNFSVELKLAEVLVWQEKYYEALPILKTLNERQPNEADVAELLGDVHYRLKDYQEAEAVYLKSISLAASQEVKRKLAEVLLWQDKREEALSLLLVLQKEDPANIKINELLADTYYRLSDYGVAEGLYRNLYAKTKEQKYEKKLAEVLLWQKKNVEAMSLLAALHQHNLEDLEVAELLANGYYAQADYAAAEKMYSQVIKKTPDYDVRRKLAEVLLWQKKMDEGISLLESLIAEEPSDYKVSELLADAYAWNKNYDAAIALYRKLIESLPEQKELVLKLADVLRDTGRNEEATGVYQQYLQKKIK